VSGLEAVWHETRLNEDAITNLRYRFTDVAGFYYLFRANEGR
jgi:hypothetical protein